MASLSLKMLHIFLQRAPNKQPINGVIREDFVFAEHFFEISKSIKILINKISSIYFKLWQVPRVSLGMKAIEIVHGYIIAVLKK